MALKGNATNIPQINGNLSANNGMTGKVVAGILESIKEAGDEQVERVETMLNDLSATAETFPPGSSASVIYENQTFMFGIPRGEPGASGPAGADGYSPTVTVTDIAGGHRVSITDADGTKTFDVMDGDIAEAPVQDVQVNGTSVLGAGGVANVPIMSTTQFGVAKIKANRGIMVDTDGTLKTDYAATTACKTGANNYLVITPGFQHTSTFYGLAKAAGDSTQSASSNAVGTYTDAAKVAIQKMLGIADLIASVEGAQSAHAYAVGGVFIYGGKLYKATAAIAVGEAIAPGTNCTQTTLVQLIGGN